MVLNINIPEQVSGRPNITVFGIGGAGGNAVNNMIQSGLQGVRFIVANTDSQSLENSLAETKIQLGMQVTKGLGAGASPEIGGAAAEESIEEINQYLDDCNMVFITAGMGGGTGTGAAPIIARTARDRGILTVAVVTKPFDFEGSHRARIADIGLEELQANVDTLIVIPNQNLFKIADEKTTFADAFSMADNVLHAGVRGVTDLITMPGMINLDFADIRSIMTEMGKAMMGTGEASGEGRALAASEAAISNPLLDNVSMHGARGVLINITGGADMTLFEVNESANRIKNEVDPDANIIFGSTFDPNIEGNIRVSVIATGINDISNIPPNKSDNNKANNNFSESNQSNVKKQDIITAFEDNAENEEFYDKISNSLPDTAQEDSDYPEKIDHLVADNEANNNIENYNFDHFSYDESEKQNKKFVESDQKITSTNNNFSQLSSKSVKEAASRDYDNSNNNNKQPSNGAFGLFGLMGSRMGFNKGLINKNNNDVNIKSDTRRNNSDNEYEVRNYDVTV
ncbi:MAG: cell division protein FtsZ, partial [Pseudomonadota bacterium]